MDFWDHLFDTEYKQRVDIDSLRRLSNARTKARRRDLQKMEDQQQRIQQLEDEVSQLALLCRTLLTILREDGTIAAERFEQVMNQIDAEDGVVDGKLTPQAPPNQPPDAPEINAW